jgi:glycosyltransferase involved in cell wall biosynthesis
MIHEVEYWLTYEAWKVVCCSEYMASSTTNLFYLPEDKVMTIYNGVDPQDFDIDFDKDSFRDWFALPDEKLILYVGRLVYEKGAHILLESFPKILSKVNAKLVIVGEGYMKDRLRNQAEALGIARKVYITGFLDDDTVRKLYKCADVCVVPSLYEPFGITALEAMAAKTPVVVSNTGGLCEIIEHERTGVKVPPGNPNALADAVVSILTNPEFANRLRENAFKEISKRFNWNEIALEMKKLYSLILGEYQKVPWKP